jgi:hypothetical protein
MNLQSSKGVLYGLYALALFQMGAWLVLLVVTVLRISDGASSVSFEELIQGVPGEEFLKSALGLATLASWTGAIYIWALRLASKRAGAPTLVFLLLGGMIVGGTYVLLFASSVLGAPQSESRLRAAAD